MPSSLSGAASALSDGCDPCEYSSGCCRGRVVPPEQPSFLRFPEAAFEAPFPRAEAPLSLFPERSPLSTGRDGLRKSCSEAKRFQKVRRGGCPPRGRAGAAGAGCPRAELLLGARVRSAAAVTPLFPSAATGSASGPRLYFPLLRF